MSDSILPDVIEWGELRTRRRQEGIYYGIRTLIRKLTGALIIFIRLQTLDWSGYQVLPDDITQSRGNIAGRLVKKQCLGIFG